MNKKKAEAYDRFGTRTSYMNGTSKQLSRFQYKAGGRSSQCRKCGSDYMRASIDGYCQRCLQLIEHTSRESPEGFAAIPDSRPEPV